MQPLITHREVLLRAPYHGNHSSHLPSVTLLALWRIDLFICTTFYLLFSPIQILDDLNVARIDLPPAEDSSIHELELPHLRGTQ